MIGSWLTADQSVQSDFQIVDWSLIVQPHRQWQFFEIQKLLIVGEPVLHHLASNLSQIVKMVVGLWLWKRNQCFQDKHFVSQYKAFLWKASNPILALCNLKKMVVGLWHSKRNQCFEDKPCSLISFCHLQLQHPYFSQTMTVSGVEKRSPDEFTI